MERGRLLCKALAVAVIILFIFLAIQPSVAVQPEEKIDVTIQIKGDEKDLYPVFGFLPGSERSIVYSYWVIPGIQARVYIDSFEGHVGIFTIKGFSTEPPYYHSTFIPESIMNLILKVLNLI